MNSTKNIFILLILAVCVCALTRALPSPRVKRQTEPAAVEETQSNDLNPIDSQEDNFVDDVTRNGRAIPAGNGKDDDTPEFNRDMVSLDIPDQLFSQSFSTLTNVSKIASRFIMNSARRYARFILFFKPLFGDALTVEGYNPPSTTTERS